MATKKQKVVASSNKRTGSASGSAATVKKFKTPEALNEFTRLIDIPVAKERGFIPLGIYSNLRDMISATGWTELCDAPAAVPLSIVREFYAHAKAESNGYSWVRGLKVDYRAKAIRSVLHQQARADGVEDWTLKSKAEVDLENIVVQLCVPGTKWTCKANTTEPLKFPASAMNRYARAWNLLICANIMPSGHASDVTVDRAILLWGILTGKYIDVGYIIHQNILKFLSKGSKSIPHASIVMRLCTAVGVTWTDDEQLQLPMTPINHKTIERLAECSGGIPRLNGLGYELSAGGSEQRQVQGAPRQDRADASQRGRINIISYLDSQFRRQNRRIDAIYEANRQFHIDMTSALSTVFQAFGVSAQWPVFGSHAIYPPPDSPESGDSSDE